MKECTVCKKILPLINFQKSYKNNNSLRSNCRDCENKRRRESYEKNPITGILQNIKLRCKKFNIEFNITQEDVPIPDVCPILKVPLKRGTKNNYKYSPTVDRIDPNKGYTKGNVRVISMMANRMKSNATLEEIKLFCQNILNYINNDIV